MPQPGGMPSMPIIIALESLLKRGSTHNFTKDVTSKMMILIKETSNSTQTTYER